MEILANVEVVIFTQNLPDMVIVTGSYINVLILMCIIYFYVVYESPICKSIIIINYGSSRLPAGRVI